MKPWIGDRWGQEIARFVVGLIAFGAIWLGLVLKEWLFPPAPPPTSEQLIHRAMHPRK